MDNYIHMYPDRRFVGFWRQHRNLDDHLAGIELCREPVLQQARQDDLRRDAKYQLPWPGEFPTQDAVTTDTVLRHLESGAVCGQYFGWSACRICGKQNGSTDLTDGVWVWPEGLVHYVKGHGIGLPQDFIEHVMRSETHT